MRKKKSRLDVISRIDKISPKKEEIITLFYPIGKVSIKCVDDMYHYLDKHFKKYDVIALPDITTLDVLSDKALEDYLCHVKKLIEKRHKSEG